LAIRLVSASFQIIIELSYRGRINRSLLGVILDYTNLIV